MLLQAPVMLTQGCLQTIRALEGAVTGYQLSNPYVKKALNMYLEHRQTCLFYWLSNPCVEKVLNRNSPGRQVSRGLLQQRWAVQNVTETTLQWRMRASTHKYL